MTSSGPRPGGREDRARRAVGIYRRLLRVLPGPFRREAEPALLEVFRDGWSAARGRLARIRFWAATLADLAVTAAAEFIGARRRSTSHDYQDDSMIRASRGSALASEGLAAARTLRRHPARAAFAACVLGVGVAAAVLMVALVRDIILQPLPFDDPGSLVRLREVSEGRCCYWPSFPNIRDWREQADVLAGVVAASPPADQPLLLGDRAVLAPVGGVSRGFFELLGVQPAVGRSFTEDENAPGGPAVAVVSWRFWSGALAGRPLGDLEFGLGRERFQVVGVLPRDFRFLAHAGAWDDVAVWTPLERAEDLGARTSHGYHVVARLADGVPLGRARTEMDLLATRLKEAHGEPTHADQVMMSPLLDDVVGDLREALQLLLVAAVGVLLVACLNLSAALIGQGLGRVRELSIRAALGAGRARLVRQMVFESLLLAAPATLAGLGLAWGGLALFRRETIGVLPRLDQVAIDGVEAAIGVGLAVVAATAAGLLPAMLAASRSSGAHGGRSVTEGRENRMIWRAFVAGQTALTTVLLVGCGLLLRSFMVAAGVDLGYDPDGVLSVEVTLPEALYEEPEQRTAFYERAVRDIRAVPGVTDVGITNILPYETSALTGTVARAGGQERVWTSYRYVDPGYFRALRIPSIQGEELPRTSEAEPEILIDTRLATGLWPEGGALGDGLEWPSRVVGLVGAVREWDQEEGVGAIYIDYRAGANTLHMYLMIRHEGRGADVAASVRSVLARIDPMVPVEANALDGLVRAELADRRLLLLVAAAFGLVALALAATGVYSVVAFAARRRRREAAIRLSLGARAGQVGRAMMAQGMAPAFVGVGLGLVAAYPAGVALRAQLFGVEPFEPGVIAGAAVFLVATAAVASWLPSRHAANVEPSAALKAE